jgi:WD40 repeat protein
MRTLARPRLAGAITRSAVIALVSLAACGQDAHAQYFGRAKVQYEHMDFHVASTAHFDVHYYPEARIAAADAARMAERWYARHAALLPLSFEHNPLVLYADQPDFQQSNVIEEMIGEGTAGVTEGLRARVIIPFTGAYGETDHVLGHELVHVFQYRLAAASGAGRSALGAVPLWFIEGMAEYLSAGRDDPNTATWLRDAVLRDKLPTLEQLTRDTRFFPYRYGQALWVFIGATWGDEVVDTLFREAVQIGWRPAIASVLGVSPEVLGQRWHDAIRSAYADVAGRTRPENVGRSLVSGRDAEHNVAPTISPDGRLVAFFSSRALFSIELYLADVATGRVLRQLTSAMRDRHFDALSFVASAGAWSPDGKQLAFVVYAGGNNELRIVDAQSGRTERRVQIGGVGALSGPAWSPDGGRIAFSGLDGGISDLYVLDLATGQATRLTDDREAQVHPAWSPDGATLAYSTDAGSATDFAQLRYGPMRLALIDVSSRSIRLLPGDGRGKEINPQFAPDGNALYYISDADGVSDIYRLDLATAARRRVTRIATGISGITAVSPAMSVAAGTGDLAFSVFDRQGFSIRALAAGELGGVAFVHDSGARRMGVLPPATAMAFSTVERALQSPEAGLPEPIEFEPRAYRPGLALDFVGGPWIGVAVGSGYGPAVGGGVALGFSDLLGNHVVRGFLNAPGEVRDVSADVVYVNRSRRWAWGAEAYHVPLTSVFATAARADFVIDGSTVPGIVYTQHVERTYFDEVTAFTQFPFAVTRRAEFSAGAQRISFGAEVDSLYVVNGIVVREAVSRRHAGAPFGLGSVSAAYVTDYSFFGFTSPISGGRARFQVTPVFGSLNYQVLLADYRRYFFVRPVTFAVRAIHVRREGPDGESSRLRPYFLGQPTLVRGYDALSFDVGECQAAAGQDDCPQFSRLVGSRIAVANAELRIPLFGTREFGLFEPPFFPTEIAPFVDVGLAWTRGENPSLRIQRNSTERIPVVGAGVTSRFNMFGAPILEVFWVRPFQRPGQRGYVGLQLVPGW